MHIFGIGLNIFSFNFQNNPVRKRDVQFVKLSHLLGVVELRRGPILLSTEVCTSLTLCCFVCGDFNNTGRYMGYCGKSSRFATENSILIKFIFSCLILPRKTHLTSLESCYITHHLEIFFMR